MDCWWWMVADGGAGWLVVGDGGCWWENSGWVAMTVLLASSHTVGAGKTTTDTGQTELVVAVGAAGGCPSGIVGGYWCCWWCRLHGEG